MKKKQHKISKKQEQLIALLKKCDSEMSGQDLHRALNQSEKSMGLTTVYRNVQALMKLGLIRARHLPSGELLYTSVERDIHYLTCVDCGETVRLETCPVKKINLPEQISQNFQLMFHTLEFWGLCNRCTENK